MGLRFAHFQFIPPGADHVFEWEGNYLVTRKAYQQAFHQQKILLADPAQEFRIAVIGGSSIYALWSLDILREMLRAHSHRHLKVINMGAISYGTVRELLHFPELLSLRPDVVILYTGHNEFEENLLSELRIRSAPFHSLDIWLTNSLRLYQFVSFGIHEAGGRLAKRELNFPLLSPKARVQWEIMHDKDKVYDLYRRNLESMVSLARAENIPVILSTVAFNRRTPPFTAGESNVYTEGERQFQLGNFAAAAPLLEKGLDLDLYPHRASKTSNRIVRETASKFSVPLVDADAEIVKLAPHGIPGPELFDDHCHLNWARGNRELQRLFAEKILELRLLSK